MYYNKLETSNNVYFKNTENDEILQFLKKDT